MKKIVLSLALSASLLMGSESILGEFGTSKTNVPSMFSADVGLWYITWDQTSTATDFLQNSSDALNTAYNIDSAAAAMLDLNFNYEFFSANLEYYNSGDVDGLNFDMALLGLIPYVNVELRYVKANFNGDIDVVRASDGATSAGTFESPLEIIDLILYPFNEYIGIGYRTYKYEVPQDFYIINNVTGAMVPSGSGLVDVSYEGSFYTMAVDNKKQVSNRSSYKGLVYSATFGIGKLDPKTDGFGTWTAESDATFYDIQVGYSYKIKSPSGFGYGLGAGYRYNKIDTEANTASNADNYSLMTEFNTEFHGPFIDATISF